jgi:hypothetical protein
MDKGVILTHSGQDNMLDKLKQGSCHASHLNVLWVMEEIQFKEMS